MLFRSLKKAAKFTGKDMDEDTGLYYLTPEQQAAGTWLIKELMSLHNISNDNIFRHPEVQAKNETEARSVEIPK